MLNFQGIVEIHEQSFLSAFSICMPLPLSTAPSIIFNEFSCKRKMIDCSKFI